MSSTNQTQKEPKPKQTILIMLIFVIQSIDINQHHQHHHHYENLLCSLLIVDGCQTVLQFKLKQLSCSVFKLVSQALWNFEY